MMTLSELDRLLRAPREDEHLEFKEAKLQYDSTKLYEYCTALSNEGGGKLILGVSDKPPRQVVGSQAFRDTADIASKIIDILGFRVDVQELVHPEGRVVVFHVPSRPSGTACHHKGAYLMRSGESVRPMSEDRLRSIFAEGRPDWTREVAMSGCSTDDVARLLDTQAYFDLQLQPHPATRSALLDRFSQEKLVASIGDDWSITNLGAVLFAKRLDDFSSLKRKVPRVVVYDGANKLQTKLDQAGTKGYAVGFEGLVQFINGQIQPNEVIGQALRKDVKMFPEIAVRELVANALVHQDFAETGTSVMIEIYSDRMEVSSPGQPFISPDRFIDEYQSRNERLADLMRRLGICEEKGSGIDKVVNAAEVFQLPAPDFRVSERRTTSVLFAHRNFADMDREDRIRACYQHCVLRWLMNDKMSNQSLRERFGLSKNQSGTASQVIASTLDADKIRLDDSTSTLKKFARYVPFWA